MHRGRLLTAVRVTLFAAAAALALGATAPEALAAKAALITPYDSVVSAGGRTTLRCKVERDNILRWDLPGQTVEFWANGTRIGSARTDRDGQAALTVQAGQGSGDVFVTARLAAGGSYRAPDAQILLAIRDPASARLVIVDIDKTISDASNSQVVLRSNRDIRPIPGAVQMLRDIAADATIVYITAREEYLDGKTRAWLAMWGFPRGPAFLSDGLRAQFIDPVPYKTATIRFLKGMLPNIPCGFGNKNTDADAYQANGLASLLVDTENDRPYRSFATVVRSWDELRAMNRAGQVPALGWATRFR
jgi:hypothetical protein